MPLWDTASICTPVPTLPWGGDKGHVRVLQAHSRSPWAGRGWAGGQAGGSYSGRKEAGEVDLPAVPGSADHGPLHALCHQGPLRVQLVLG